MSDTIPTPCPICGELPILTKHFREDAWGLVHRCRVWGPIIFEHTDIDRNVARWNTRPAPALTPKQEAAEEMFEALDGDGTLGVDIGNLTSIVWHLGKGDDNAGLSKDVLAAFLASVGKKLVACRAALAKAGRP